MITAGPPDASAVRLAMWVHALAGQRLAIVEGWRDFRDGSRLPYAPLGTHPDHVEVMAHTALDLLYFRNELGAFTRRATAAVVIDQSAVSQTDDNRWSPEAAELFNTLLDRQLPVEVVPFRRVVQNGVAPGCRAALIATSTANAERVQARVGKNVKIVGPAGGASAAQLCEYLAGLPEPVISRELRDPTHFVAYDPDGRVAPGCLVFNGRSAGDGPRVAAVNLRDRARSVILKSPSSLAGLRLRDVLTGETIAAGRDLIALAEHQVRVFVPAASN